MTNLSDFAAQHWVIGGTVTSLLWFFAAKQDIGKNRPGVALGGLCIAVGIIVSMAVWAARDKEWIGLAAATVVLLVELRELRRVWHSKPHDWF